MSAAEGRSAAGGDKASPDDAEQSSEEKSSRASPIPENEAATAVAIPLEDERVPRTHTVDTSLVVDQDVMVMARMGGIVESLFVDRGSRVKKGDPLLELMNRDLELLVQHADITLQQRKVDFERIKQLFEEKAVSPSQYEESKLGMESARVETEMAREEFEKSIVRAPFDGVVIDRFAKVGLKVIEDEDMPLFEITTLSPLLARLYLSEDVAHSLSKGDKVEVTPRYLQSGPIEGTIQWVSNVVDASSGTCQAIVRVPGGGEQGKLSPGTAVTIVLTLSPTDSGVLIPRSAIDGGIEGPESAAARVQVIENGTGAWRRVRLGEFRGDSVEVLNGLRPGERVLLIADDSERTPGGR
jgi:RND family efflux transporter MFP subunit